MHKILEDLLTKRGVKIESLSPDEKRDFERWNSTLDEGDITVEKISNICQQQIKIIEGKWKDLDNSNQKNERLIIMHTVYKTILSMIKAKAEERKRLEAYLTSLLHTQ